MRYHEIKGIPSIIITNEEQNFINEHGERVELSFLDEHQSYVANLLVRKGVYSLSKDRNVIFRRDDNDGRSNLQANR
jgi:hypothetical protein